ncbi:gyf domain-containing protein [Echria macrotheca]|uniref:Gyf domain-containing protein n=1 Tax=Echria macrotheca TaxID=438768 RepID=A0AAJ0BIB8_9PEZI|nr:gyf domain-containing protein [Echria macrotheca]
MPSQLPSQLPSSFASAAAGQNRDPRTAGRGDVRGSGGGEWPRSNGTRTFRRQSTTPFNQTASASTTDVSQNPTGDAPLPSMQTQSAGYDGQASFRYSKEELFEIYGRTGDATSPPEVSHLFADTWNPNHVNGASGRGWGKSGDLQAIPQDPTVCWDPNGSVRPIGLEDMSAEEREMFTTDVNSTLKLPQQGKEGGHQGNMGQNGRKTSVSMGNSGNNAMSSPSSASRPGTRRRETGDTNPFPGNSLASPTTGRFSRDDPWLRRSTDVREPITDEPEEDTSSRDVPPRNQPFAGLARSTTAGSATFGNTALWGSSAASPSTSGVGGFGNFSLTSAIGDKRFGSGSSRLAHLIPKDSSDNLAGRANEFNNADASRAWRPRQRTDTDPFANENSMSGSAILGGAQDNSPPTLPSQAHRVGAFDTPVKGGAGDFGMAGLNLGHGEGNGPASPSETNPYRSPLADRGDDAQDDNDSDKHIQGGQGSEPPSHYGTLPRNFGSNAFDGSDRSQTSSVGAKGFGTINPLTGWPAAGTPDRERQHFGSAFPSSIFPLGDLPSPSLTNLGGGGIFPGSSGPSRGSKLGSLFPAAMQAQMHGQEHENLSDSISDLWQTNPLGAIGRGPIGAPRDASSPVRADRGGFEGLYSAADAARAFSTAEQRPSGLTATAHGQSFPVSTAGGSFPSVPAPVDPSARTMVMPDRMRWVYLDPQGVQQGPFNGLEMHDWYKASFFTPDLRVKRLEDNEFEPLGQLIRRIGNSREPFLVPQMGIPHGPAPSAPLALAGTTAVPPLQSAFPSFGRTLTAAQQNDLERRKQEEQLFHARQRELAHHHQPFGRLPIQPGVPPLHHHSSAHSLQSQPSFGSISSPIGATQQPPIGPLVPTASFFESAPNMAVAQPSGQPVIGAAAEIFNPDLNINERQLLANMQAAGGLGGMFQSQQPNMSDGSGLRSQLPGIDQLQKDSQGFSARIKEFHDLRAQHDAEELAAGSANVLADVQEETDEHDAAVLQGGPSVQPVEASKIDTQTTDTSVSKADGLSLTQRVMKTQADAAAAAEVVKPSQQTSGGLPLSFPPPAQSSTPIAAPTAQRPASNLPTRYDERSASGTPDTTSDSAALAPPPTAPWAPQPGTETHKGPSLKEIQEAEAKKAAKREEIAAAARRAALELEAASLREREKAAAASVVGLPATSTWGTGSPVGTPGSGSAWKQPAAAVGAASSGATGASASKKTLAEIQREEELRKKKAQGLHLTANSGSAFGKRYADLASKGSAPAVPTAAPVPSAGGGWSTVGAGGKVKIPTGPAAQTRSVSASTVKPAVVAPPAAKAAAKTPVALKDAKSLAMEEFRKWMLRELSRGLDGITDIEQFAATLLELPADAMIVAEAVYGYSTTMDGRHFGEEFVRRKKLAERGQFDKEPAGSSAVETKSSNGGWNEVAKKGGSTAPKEDTSTVGLAAQLLAGRYVDILTSDLAQTLIGQFVASSTQSSPQGPVADSSSPPQLGPDVLAVGLASFNAFLQVNVTGPVLEGVRHVTDRFASDAEALRKLRGLCLRGLDVDGVSAYPYVPFIELFCFARWVLLGYGGGGWGDEEGEVEDAAWKVPAWMVLRVHVWHFKLLSQPSLGAGSVFVKGGQWSDVPSLQGMIESVLGEVEGVVEKGGDAGVRVKFAVEKANAREAIKRAREVGGFVYALSGALGKRTRFQEKSTSQLVVLAKSGQEGGKEAAGEVKPEALALNDDTLLENLEFTKEDDGDRKGVEELPDALKDLEPDDQPQLTPLDQIILLTEATLKDAFSPADTLTSEEILPFAVRVISDKSTNWQIYTQALLVRSRIEVHRSRTVERGVLQMQAVVDQVIVDTTAEPKTEKGTETGVPSIQITTDSEPEKKNKPTSFFPAPKPSEAAPAHVRLQYIHALSSPPRWHLECELAYSWTSVGSLVSALEIFKRLRLWAEVALCLASAAATNDEDGRGSGGEEKAKGVLRWRLFRRTGAEASQVEVDVDEEDIDVSDLKEADFQGPEIFPSPPNAPRLFCILGDIENNPAHYERAWEISKQRFARAQRSLGEYYLQQKDIGKAKEAYKKAVAVNRMSSEMWSRLGDINLRLGEFSDASDAFGKAIACADNIVGGEDARTWSNLGSALYSLYLERVKEAKSEKDQSNAEGTVTDGDDENEVIDGQETEAKKRDPATLLSQSLAAFKRGASISHDNWRIWDNVITLASRVRPPAVSEILLALRNTIRIRKTEDALDIDVLRLLLNEAVLSKEKKDDGKFVYDPPRGTPERAVCELLETQVVPLITVRSELWELITRERVWKRDYSGAVDAAERAWRAAIGAAAGGGLLPSTGTDTDKKKNWLEDEGEWAIVVERTDELVSVLENYGPDIEDIGAKWKGKARSAVRSVLGKAKESWEGSEGWERLQGLLEGLR